MKVSLLTTTGALATTNLSSELFAGEANPVLIAQAVRVYRAAARQGTAKTKTRGEVRFTKKKWFKQKHTGNARHGARTPNIFVGGGVSHGPTGTQNWMLAMPKGMRRQALRSALVHQVPNVVMVEAFAGDNKTIRQMLKEVVSVKTLTLVVLPAYDEKIVKALRNMPTVKVVTANRVTVMDVAAADKVLVTEDTIKNLEFRINGKQIEAQAVKAAPAAKATVKKAKTTEAKAATKKPVAKKK